MTIDGNHPQADGNLSFAVTVHEAREASEEVLSHTTGLAHGPGGHSRERVQTSHRHLSPNSSGKLSRLALGYLRTVSGLREIDLMSVLIASLMTLLMLTLLQAVLGFDNLLYISIESKRVPEDKQAYVRKLGIGLAIALRIVLLFVVMSTISSYQAALFHIKLGGEVRKVDEHGGEANAQTEEGQETADRLYSLIDGAFNIESLITLAGGIFIIYTAVKEIFRLV